MDQNQSSNLEGFLNKFCFNVVINCNDTFHYASADSQEVDIQDLDKLIETYEKFGDSGVHAFLSLIRNYDCLKELKSDQYFKAKEYLEGYKFKGEYD